MPELSAAARRLVVSVGIAYAGADARGLEISGARLCGEVERHLDIRGQWKRCAIQGNRRETYLVDGFSFIVVDGRAAGNPHFQTGNRRRGDHHFGGGNRGNLNRVGGVDLARDTGVKSFVVGSVSSLSQRAKDNSHFNCQQKT